MNCLFSIVIATRNSEVYLERAIKSILTQDYQNFEVVIIDGDSTDNTESIAKRFLRKTDIFLSEPDQGIYDAWNKGIALSTGTHICFLGSDDTFAPGALSALARQIECQPDVELVCGVTHLVDTHRRLLGKVRSKWDWNAFRRRMTIAHVGAAHSKKLFTVHGSFRPIFKITGDYDFLLRVGPSLRVSTMDVHLADMQYGGISNSNARALAEAFSCKVLNSAATTFEATVDLISAYIKYSVRSSIYRIKAKLGIR